MMDYRCGLSAVLAPGVTFSPDGKWLIGSDVPGYTLWEVVTGKQKFKWRSGIIEPLSAGWSSDGQWIALPSMVRPDAPPYELSPNGVALVVALALLSYCAPPENCRSLEESCASKGIKPFAGAAN